MPPSFRFPKSVMLSRQPLSLRQCVDQGFQEPEQSSMSDVNLTIDERDCHSYASFYEMCGS